MDFREFRSRIVKVPFVYDGEEFWVGYRPREILEEDIEQMAWLSQARLDVNLDEVSAAMAAQQAQQPNRAQRRAAEKAEKIAKATPAPKRREEQRRAPTIVDQMKRFVADWSLTWDGEPWPAVEEHFRLVDPMMRMAMIAAIVEDYLDRPNRVRSSTPSSEETTGSGPTGRTSASDPSNGATPATAGAASSPGTS